LTKGPAEKLAFFLSVNEMAQKPHRPSLERADIAGHINEALETSDVATICQAIWDAVQMHNVSDIAEKAGLQRSSIYRAFGGERTPNFSTVLNVLSAMGLRLKVARRR
jgi:probable addiction module antidote protein